MKPEILDLCLSFCNLLCSFGIKGKYTVYKKDNSFDVVIFTQDIYKTITCEISMSISDNDFYIDKDLHFVKKGVIGTRDIAFSQVVETTFVDLSYSICEVVKSHGVKIRY